MSSALVPCIITYLHSLDSLSPTLISDLWTTGYRIYIDHLPEITHLERKFTSGFDIKWPILVKNIYILLLKSVLNTIKSTENDAKTVLLLTKKRLIWSWFSDFLEFQTLLNTHNVSNPQKTVYFAYLYRILYSKSTISKPKMQNFRLILHSLELQTDLDLLEELRLLLPSISTSLLLYKSIQLLFKSHPFYLHFYPNYDDFIQICMEFINKLEIFPLSCIKRRSWNVGKEIVVMDLMEDVEDEGKIGFAVIEFVRMTVKFMFGRQKASFADCLCDDFGKKATKNDLKTRFSEEIDDGIVKFYSFEDVKWKKVWRKLDFALFGREVRWLNAECVQFLTNLESWNCLDRREFRRKWKKCVERGSGERWRLRRRGSS